MSDLYKDQFLKAAQDWVCDSFSVDIRYIAQKEGDTYVLLGASIGLAPLPWPNDMSFSIEADGLFAGQIQLVQLSKEKILSILDRAAKGQIEVNDHLLTLRTDRPYNYFAELIHSGDRWFSDLHLQVIGNLNTNGSLSHIDSCRIDNALRKCSPPFDGMADLTGWLGLKNPQQSHEAPSINIRVSPPVDLILSECNLNENALCLVLHAHPSFDLSRLGFAVRALPGIGVLSRKQVTSNVKWGKIRGGIRRGKLKMPLSQADSALVMLMIGDNTVRRQWFLDTAKSSNNRLTAIQCFDKELRMVKRAIFETTESARFENGIAALLFLMGFSPAVQLEDDAPDIVVTTPSGRIILVECTTRIADFSLKLGKLVDRKGTLTKILENSKNHTRVDAVLVCAQPRAQIVVRTDELQTHQVVLVTKEELLNAFDQLRFHADPDKLIDDALAQLARGNISGPV